MSVAFSTIEDKLDYVDEIDAEERPQKETSSPSVTVRDYRRPYGHPHEKDSQTEEDEEYYSHGISSEQAM